MHPAVSSAIEEFERALQYLSKEFAGLQIGRASAGLVEGIEVEAYGSRQPLRNIAQISLPDPRSIAITPFDKNLLGNVEKAIRDSSLNISPTNDGHSVRLNIPPLTEERRKDVVKVVHEKAEHARVTIRQLRHEALEKIKKDELSEDEEKRAEKELQDKVDEYNKKIDEHAKKKEQEVMTI